MSALAYFVMLAFAIPAAGSRAEAFLRLLDKRTRRLIVPWLFWSIVYAGVYVVLGRPIVFRPLVGTDGILWYLPFTFFGALATWWITHMTREWPRRLVFPALVIAFLMLIASRKIVDIGHLGLPWDQWMYACPLVPMGIAIGLAAGLPIRLKLAAWLLTVAAAAFVWWQWNEPSYLIGCLGLIVVFDYLRNDIPWLRNLAELSMGIYLIHPLAFLFVWKFASHAPWFIFLAVGFWMSAIVTYVMSLSPIIKAAAFGSIDPAGTKIVGEISA